MLGASLAPALAACGHQVVSHGRGVHWQARADLTDGAATQQMVDSVGPEAVINLAGLTDVDLCESEPQKAWRSNVLTTLNVAAACRCSGARLVHISTDQVYEGQGCSTEDQAAPGNYYAITKHAGELAAAQAGATILRTIFFGASRVHSRRSLTDWLCESLRARRPIQVFADVYFSPLSMPTLCGMIEKVARREAAAGVFNLGSRDGMSKADFAFEFARTLDLPLELMTRVSIRQARLKARRPTDMRMCNDRIEKLLGQAMPRLADEIDAAAKDYRDVV